MFHLSDFLFNKVCIVSLALIAFRYIFAIYDYSLCFMLLVIYLTRRLQLCCLSFLGLDVHSNYVRGLCNSLSAFFDDLKCNQAISRHSREY